MPTPTAIPDVVLNLSGVLTYTAQLAAEQQTVWGLHSDTGPLYLSIGALVLMFWLLLLIRSFLWRRSSDGS